MRKKRRHKKQSSLVKNVGLLLLSLALLGVASVLFSTLSHRSDLSLDPIQSTWKGIVSHEEKPEAALNKPSETKKGSVAPFDYSFYDILNKKDPSKQAEENFTIQVGTFRNKDQAKQFAHGLKEKSRLSFRIDREGRFHCVRWGTFTTRQAAQKYCEKLSDKLNRYCKVVKI